MKQKRTNPNKSERFLLSGVRLFLSKPELSGMTIQNEYGAISVRRDTEPKTAVHAIGFAVDDEDDYDEHE
ncbi:hypothetical protein [Pumilibacter intestinalis]|uniref:hypothetical protein n=1 Tax=Pumilibacter intestinalis TaxID=2941511 RepID=UPI00203B8221|nr:hypothetical protein [Pumilibacter intestinalis]